MITDTLNAFLPVGSNLPITNAAVASNVYDILGAGVGVAPPNIIGNRTVFGSDVGLGLWRALLACAVGTAFAGGTSLAVAFQGAVDTGAGGGFLPGTWITLVDQPAITLAQLTAGQTIARFDFPPAFPPGTLPRFLRLLFTPTGVFTAGTIAFALVTLGRDDQANKFAGKNYAVA